MRRFGSSYLERVFGPAELDRCQAPVWLAECFAAKEATVKALSPVLTGADWRSMVLRAHMDGSRSMHLSGGAWVAARTLGLTQLRVSVCSDGARAFAIALARLEGATGGGAG